MTTRDDLDTIGCELVPVVKWFATGLVGVAALLAFVAVVLP